MSEKNLISNAGAIQYKGHVKIHLVTSRGKHTLYDSSNEGLRPLLSGLAGVLAGKQSLATIIPTTIKLYGSNSISQFDLGITGDWGSAFDKYELRAVPITEAETLTNNNVVFRAQVSSLGSNTNAIYALALFPAASSLSAEDALACYRLKLKSADGDAWAPIIIQENDTNILFIEWEMSFTGGSTNE
jgi:hypothetical protein